MSEADLKLLAQEILNKVADCCDCINLGATDALRQRIAEAGLSIEYVELGEDRQPND